MTTDPNAFLMGTGGKSAEFKRHGDQVWGVVRSFVMRQQTDFKTNKPLTWDDGSPRMQLVVTLQTDEHEDDDDDGLRNVYIRGQLQKVTSDAIRKAGARGIAEGGKLLVRYVSDAEPAGKGMSGAKQYFVKYEAPQYQVEGPGDTEDALPF